MWKLSSLNLSCFSVRQMFEMNAYRGRKSKQAVCFLERAVYFASNAPLSQKVTIDEYVLGDLGLIKQDWHSGRCCRRNNNKKFCFTVVRKFDALSFKENNFNNCCPAFPSKKSTAVFALGIADSIRYV